MHNPYAAPQAGLEPLFQPAGASRLFALNGRIGRVRYVACCVLGIAFALLYGVCAGWFAYLAERGGLLALDGWVLRAVAAPVFLIPMAAALVATRRRLHDFDVSGWWVLMLLFPLFQFVFVIYLLVSPGSPEANSFGPVPAPTPLAVRLVAVVGGLLLAGLIALRFL